MNSQQQITFHAGMTFQECLELEAKLNGQITVDEYFKKSKKKPKSARQKPKLQVYVPVVLEQWSPERIKNIKFDAAEEDDKQLMNTITGLNSNKKHSGSLKDWQGYSQRAQEIRDMMRFSGISESVDYIPPPNETDDDKSCFQLLPQHNISAQSSFESEFSSTCSSQSSYKDYTAESFFESASSSTCSNQSTIADHEEGKTAQKIDVESEPINSKLNLDESSICKMIGEVFVYDTAREKNAA